MSSKFFGSNLKLFNQLKLDANGYLHPEVYRNLYIYSFSSSEGYVIDIGSAQGATSISLAMGIRDSNKNFSKVICIEKGIGSSSLKSHDNKEDNLKTLQYNINKYGVGDYSQIHFGSVEEIFHTNSNIDTISMMLIDADGALDRDFNLFFNKIQDDAIIAIDDYSPVINKHARTKYLRWNDFELEKYAKSKGVNSFHEACPLGKEFTVYTFTNYLLTQGLIRIENIIGTTIFTRKCNKAIFLPRHYMDLRELRKDILSKYYEVKKSYIS
jgi:predicted O-methyltransferase YrrM